jgi:hypothetical protein
MNEITKPGAFHLGCNYWASHAGTRMWADWQSEVVDRDFQLLAESGLQTIRIFPLWPDFQPIHALGTAWNPTKEFRFGEEPLPDDALGRAGLSAVMLERFAICLDLAERHGLHCIVGLITGWMSGRLFVPPGLAGRNPLTDPLSIQWQVRFVREFVGSFKGHAAVCAWDLGNECNCMGAATREQAFVWAASITHAIRAADPERPVVSGMHSLTPEGAWTMQDQGELTDLLTTHPYPPFTPHCGQDPVNTIRGILHGTAESRFYADIGGKPCLCEEFGTLGNMIADEATAADYVRACLFSLWANDCHGALWWCAFDQGHLAHAPYDWCAVERELGLFGTDGRSKPVAGVYREFRAMLDKLPFQTLPPRRTEAVCLLTRDQDQWGVAYSAFILAKQAGFDLTFRYAGQILPDAPIYLMPCLKGLEILYRRHWPALLDRVAAGATLYLSLDDALPSGFEALTGLRPTARDRRAGYAAVALDGIPGRPVIPCAGGYRLNATPVGANVLASEPEGAPLLTEYRYGKGRVIFLGVSLEMTLTTTPGVFHGANASAAWQLYCYIADGAMQGRAVRKEEPLLALTEHPVSETERIIVAVNQSPGPLKARVRLTDGWRLAECLHGEARVEGWEILFDLLACDGSVLRVETKEAQA